MDPAPGCMLLLCIPGLHPIVVGDQPWIYEWKLASSPAPSGMPAECCDPAGCCNAGSGWLSGQAPHCCCLSRRTRRQVHSVDAGIGNLFGNCFGRLMAPSSLRVGLLMLMAPSKCRQLSQHCNPAFSISLTMCQLQVPGMAPLPLACLLLFILAHCKQLSQHSNPMPTTPRAR